MRSLSTMRAKAIKAQTKKVAHSSQHSAYACSWQAGGRQSEKGENNVIMLFGVGSSSVKERVAQPGSIFFVSLPHFKGEIRRRRMK